MTGPLTSLDAAVRAVREVWAGALPPFGVAEGDASVLLGQMDDEGLLAVVDALTDLGRRVDALTAAAAGEVAERSPLGSRANGLAYRKGYASPARLVAAASGGSVGRAAVLAAVGQATTAGRRSLTGEDLPPVYPHLAAVVREGRVSVDAAHRIIVMLDRLPSRVGPAKREEAEALLAEAATVLSLEELCTAMKRIEAHVNPDGIEPREEVLREGRSLVVVEDASGRITLRGVFDPETGAPIKVALDAYVSNALRTARGHHHPDHPEADADTDADAGTDADADADADTHAAAADAATPVMEERRSPAQMRADALADFARHVLGCEDRVAGLPVVTAVVRMDLEDLQQQPGGSRAATLDGIAQPVSAGTARRLACAAELIPAVFGGASVPLDLGRSARLFSRAQTLALWERDGGCASCGQTVFVETHHVEEWARHGGATDLGKGVLLCSRCHHRVHREDWQIRIDRDRVWFIPPPTDDPLRTPRPGVQRRTLRERRRQQHKDHDQHP